MGIAELWKVISPSEQKYTLEQLAESTLKKNKKGLRVAIDVALWIFQSRSSVVGDASELRSLFFRFIRLYELGIRPVFVFDGSHRPGYKRNKFINTTPIDNEFRRQLIQLIQLFQFSQWHAYGEAEAECAMLQRLGFVDLVFTGDNDVFLFGAQRVVRQWPSKRNEAVSCYDMRWISDTVGLDRSDLILMALLRGSDYDTKGTKGIGIQVATQLAKCRFHRGLMDDIQLTGRHVSLDEERVQHLYDDLTYELQHNNTKNLTKRHTGIVLDPTFPDFSIVTDFIHPLTNICRPESKLKAQRLASCLDHHQEPNWTELAHFIQHTFKWPAEYVLKRFSSLLFPAFMKNKISQQYHERYRPTPRVQPTTQPRLEDYYRPTSRLFRDRQPRIVHITHKKQALCRVEWHKSCWEQFLSLLKPKLDYELYQQETDVLDQEVMDYKQEMQANDIFDAIKRQWIAVDHIQALYSHLQTNALFIPKRKKINY